MTNPHFTESKLRDLLEAIQMRASSFADHLYNRVLPNDNPIYLRFDIDDQSEKAYRMSLILNEYGIRGTFFVLNTAKYWGEGNKTEWYDNLLEALTKMQSKGHEIGWHNNALAGWLSLSDKIKSNLKFEEYAVAAIEMMRMYHLNIRGSASHGDPLCRRLGFINYEIFKECERTSEAIGFPSPSFDFPRVSMADFGLEYEAYHVPYDLYLSESGGQGWTLRRTGENAVIWDGEYQIERLLKEHDRIQILIHPQHWQI